MEGDVSSALIYAPAELKGIAEAAGFKSEWLVHSWKRKHGSGSGQALASTKGILPLAHKDTPQPAATSLANASAPSAGSQPETPQAPPTPLGVTQPAAAPLALTQGASTQAAAAPLALTQGESTQAEAAQFARPQGDLQRRIQEKRAKALARRAANRVMPLGDAQAAAAPLAPTQGAAAPTEEASQPGEQNASPTPSPEVVPLCAICKEPLVGAHVTALPCAHSFHTGCIQHWADV